MEKMKITDYHYYPESDELDLVINVDKPRPAISVPLEDEFFFLRVDPETDEIVGATILNVSRWFAQLAHVFAVRAFDDTDVHLLLEKKVETLALQRA
jgi:hypothetical protein